MADSGSENRKRQNILKARFTDQEAALVREQADRSGVSVAALIRYALLDQTPPRASRQPPANRKEISRLIGTLGEVTQALKDATDTGDQARLTAQIDATHRDIADMCFACFEALGRER
jgi:hypothetical protein